MKLFALFAALAVYGLWECRHTIWDMIRNSSPTTDGERGSWVKALLGKGSDPDPDSDRKGYRLVDDGAHTYVEWGRDEEDPTLDEYVADLMDREDLRTVDIIDDARRRYRVSESTVKRAMRRIRAQA